MASSAQIQSIGQGVGNWSEDPLGFLISPVTPAVFFERYYELAPLLGKRSDPTRYADLLTLEALDTFIDGADLREGMLELANRHNPVPASAYINQGGRIITPVVAEEYMKGATIILPHLHDSMANLGEFCRALEEVFTCHVQTNIYLTPQNLEEGTANQVFATHYDNHDVFVMQISGTKAWRFYGQPVATPYRGEGFQPGQFEAGPVTEEFTLNAGDCIYVPRGLMHDAQNVGPEPSLHITVGLIVKTWADLLLESVSELALNEPAFRRSLPPGYATRDFDREVARRQFAELIGLVSQKASMDAAFDLMADTFVRDRRPNLSGVIARPAVPEPGERFRRRRFVPWTLAEDEGELVLVGPGGDIGFNQDDGDALERALSGEPFSAEELGCKEPEDLVRRLWANGYIERVPVR